MEQIEDDHFIKTEVPKKIFPAVRVVLVQDDYDDDDDDDAKDNNDSAIPAVPHNDR